MESTLSNTVSAVGNYDDIPTAITSTATVVTMVSGLNISKTADKNVWADGVLTYTIIIENKTQKTYGTPEIKDTLDLTLIDFVEGSVTIDSAKSSEDDYEYNQDTGVLTVNLSDIAASGSSVVTFQVKKK